MSLVEGGAAAVWGVIGILLGGGVASVRDWLVRRSESRALDAALTAEVEALLETIEVRGLRQSLERARLEVEGLIVQKRMSGAGVFPQFSATWNYFAAFDAILPKIGSLPSKRAGLFVRFYVAAKSSSEMLMRRPGSQMGEIPLDRLYAHLLTEAYLADRVIKLGQAILRNGTPWEITAVEPHTPTSSIPSEDEDDPIFPCQPA